MNAQNFEIGKPTNEFHIAVTDVGLCQVYNGEAMRSTFTTTSRIEELAAALDKRDHVMPRRINGSGRIYEKTFWLDIGDRYIILLPY